MEGHGAELQSYKVKYYSSPAGIWVYFTMADNGGLYYSVFVTFCHNNKVQHYDKFEFSSSISSVLYLQSVDIDDHFNPASWAQYRRKH